MKKRLLCAALVFLMLLQMFPVVASAVQVEYADADSFYLLGSQGFSTRLQTGGATQWYEVYSAVVHGEEVQLLISLELEYVGAGYQVCRPAPGQYNSTVEFIGVSGNGTPRYRLAQSRIEPAAGYPFHGVVISDGELQGYYLNEGNFIGHTTTFSVAEDCTVWLADSTYDFQNDVWNVENVRKTSRDVTLNGQRYEDRWLQYNVWIDLNDRGEVCQAFVCSVTFMNYDDPEHKVVVDCQGRPFELWRWVSAAKQTALLLFPIRYEACSTSGQDRIDTNYLYHNGQLLNAAEAQYDGLYKNSKGLTVETYCVWNEEYAAAETISVVLDSEVTFVEWVGLYQGEPYFKTYGSREYVKNYDGFKEGDVVVVDFCNAHSKLHDKYVSPGTNQPVNYFKGERHVYLAEKKQVLISGVTFTSGTDATQWDRSNSYFKAGSDRYDYHYKALGELAVLDGNTCIADTYIGPDARGREYILYCDKSGYVMLWEQPKVTYDYQYAYFVENTWSMSFDGDTTEADPVYAGNTVFLDGTCAEEFAVDLDTYQLLQGEYGQETVGLLAQYVEQDGVNTITAVAQTCGRNCVIPGVGDIDPYAGVSATTNTKFLVRTWNSEEKTYEYHSYTGYKELATDYPSVIYSYGNQYAEIQYFTSETNPNKATMVFIDAAMTVTERNLYLIGFEEFRTDIQTGDNIDSFDVYSAVVDGEKSHVLLASDGAGGEVLEPGLYNSQLMHLGASVDGLPIYCGIDQSLNVLNLDCAKWVEMDGDQLYYTMTNGTAENIPLADQFAMYLITVSYDETEHAWSNVDVMAVEDAVTFNRELVNNGGYYDQQIHIVYNDFGLIEEGYVLRYETYFEEDHDPGYVYTGDCVVVDCQGRPYYLTAQGLEAIKPVWTTTNGIKEVNTTYLYVDGQLMNALEAKYDGLFENVHGLVAETYKFYNAELYKYETITVILNTEVNFVEWTGCYLGEPYYKTYGSTEYVKNTEGFKEGDVVIVDFCNAHSKFHGRYVAPGSRQVDYTKGEHCAYLADVTVATVTNASFTNDRNNAEWNRENSYFKADGDKYEYHYNALGELVFEGEDAVIDDTYMKSTDRGVEYALYTDKAGYVVLWTQNLPEKPDYKYAYFVENSWTIEPGDKVNPEWDEEGEYSVSNNGRYFNDVVGLDGMLTEGIEIDAVSMDWIKKAYGEDKVGLLAEYFVEDGVAHINREAQMSYRNGVVVGVGDVDPDAGVSATANTEILVRTFNPATKEYTYTAYQGYKELAKDYPGVIFSYGNEPAEIQYFASEANPNKATHIFIDAAVATTTDKFFLLGWEETRSDLQTGGLIEYFEVFSAIVDGELSEVYVDSDMIEVGEAPVESIQPGLYNSEIVYLFEVDGKPVYQAIETTLNVLNADVAQWVEMDGDQLYYKQANGSVENFPVTDEFTMWVVDISYNEKEKTWSDVEIKACSDREVFNRELVNNIGYDDILVYVDYDDSGLLKEGYVVRHKAYTEENDDPGHFFGGVYGGSGYADFTITFVDDNGEVILSRGYNLGSRKYGLYIPLAPEKPADEMYVYTFAGWYPEIKNFEIYEDSTFKATYTKQLREYTVTWVVNDQKIKEQYYYGDMPECAVITERPADDQHTYTFIGWDKEIEAVTGDVTYTAQYEATPISVKDPITFTTSMSATVSLENEIILYVNPQMTGFPEGFKHSSIYDRVGVMVWLDGTTEDKATIENAKEEYIFYASAFNASTNRYEVECNSIPAKEMARNMSVRAFYLNDNGEYVYGKFVEEYSVRKYAYSKRNHAADGPVCIAMLNYGAAAQKYFGYQADDLANKDLTDAQKNYTWDASLVRTEWTYPEAKQGALVRDNDYVTSRAGTLELMGAINYQWTFRTPGTVDKAEVLIWTEAKYQAVSELTEANASEIRDLVRSPGDDTAKGAAYVLIYEGLPAKKMFEPVYACAKFTDAEGNVHYSGVMALCPERWASTNINKTTEKDREMARTMIVYGAAARTRFGG